MPFNAALSGLQTSNLQLCQLAENIHKASTTGFKKSRAEFRDVFVADAMVSRAYEEALGVTLTLMPFTSYHLNKAMSLNKSQSSDEFLTYDDHFKSQVCNGEYLGIEFDETMEKYFNFFFVDQIPATRNTIEESCEDYIPLQKMHKCISEVINALALLEDYFENGSLESLNNYQAQNYPVKSFFYKFFSQIRKESFPVNYFMSALLSNKDEIHNLKNCFVKIGEEFSAMISMIDSYKTNRENPEMLTLYKNRKTNVHGLLEDRGCKAESSAFINEHRSQAKF